MAEEDLDLCECCKEDRLREAEFLCIDCERFCCDWCIDLDTYICDICMECSEMSKDA